MNVNQVKACSFVKITMTNRTGEKVKINVIIHKLNNNASSIILTASPTIKLKKMLNCNIKCIKNFKNLYRQRITQ